MLDMFSRLIHVHVSGKIEWSVHVVQSAEHGFCTHPHCTCQKITIRLRVDERLLQRDDMEEPYYLQFLQ